MYRKNKQDEKLEKAARNDTCKYMDHITLESEMLTHS